MYIIEIRVYKKNFWGKAVLFQQTKSIDFSSWEQAVTARMVIDSLQLPGYSIYTSILEI